MSGELRYLNVLSECLYQGTPSANRTGIGTFKCFGGFWMCEDVIEDFPLLTTKRVHWPSVVAELLWFLSGSTNIRDLDARIWDEWADEGGELGPIYGAQWRSWPLPVEFEGSIVRCDQIRLVENELRADPDSRRMLVSAWNVSDIPFMALAPCHYAFQLQHSDGDLNMLVNMRSVDVFLGLPFNIASYGLLLMMFAHVSGLRARRLCFSLGDYHLYQNHIEQAKTQLGRRPHQAPWVLIAGQHQSITEIAANDIQLSSYEPWPAIKAEVAV